MESNMTDPNCPSVTNINPTYPEINQEVLLKLRKIPETVLGVPVMDNANPEVRNIELAIHETLKVMEDTLILSGVQVEQVDVTEDGQTESRLVKYEVRVENLAAQYFDMVSN